MWVERRNESLVWAVEKGEVSDVGVGRNRAGGEKNVAVAAIVNSSGAHFGWSS